MKNTYNRIGIIAFIFAVLSVGIGVFTFKMINSLNSEFTRDYIFISAIAGIAAFFIAIASNLIAFYITYFFDQKHINEKHDAAFDILNRKQDEAFKILTEIERHTKKESIVLKSENGKLLLNVGFFDNIYNNASDIRISGIKMTPLIDYICNEIKSNENWVKQLENREHVIVKILMSSPKSKIVSMLEEQEQLNTNDIANEIQNSLNKLKTFSTSSNTKLANGSSISIRVTEDSQYFNITYAGNVATQPTDTLLLGFLFNKSDGPVYEILPSTVNTYDECLILFNNLYKNGKEIFKWNEKGIKYTEWKKIRRYRRKT